MDIQIKTTLYKKHKQYSHILPGGFVGSLLNPKNLESNTNILLITKEGLKNYVFKPYSANLDRKEKLGYLLESLIGIRILIKNIK